MADEWYYRQNDESRGPVSRGQLEQLALAGQIGPASLVWRDGLSDWTTVAVLGLLDKAAPPIPPPPVLAPAAPPITVVPRPARKPAVDTSRQPLWIAAAGLAIVVAAAGGWFGQALIVPRDEAKAVALAPVPQPVPARASAAPPVVENATAATVKAPAAVIPAANEGENRPESSSTQPPPPPTLPTPPAAPSTTPGTPPPAATAPVASPSPSPSSSATTPTPPPPRRNPDVLYQEVDVQRAPKFTILGTSTVQDIRYKILSELRPGQPDAKGLRAVEQHVVDTRLVKADDLSKPIFTESLRELVGFQFAYQLNKRNEVTKFLPVPAGGRKAAKVAPKGGQGFLLSTVMDEDGWKELAQISFFVPEEKSRGNQPWTRPMQHDFRPLGSWYGETRFVRGPTEDHVLRVDYTHQMTYRPPGGDAGELPFAVKDAKFTTDVAGGSFYFDTQLGRIRSAEDRFVVRGVVTTEILGMEAAVEVEEQQTTTLRLFEQNPWSQSESGRTP